jgi:hypothetical protein
LCVKISRWERRIIVYTASYKLKVISFAEQFRNRAAQREFGILESNVGYWRKQKELLKNAKSGSRAFRGPKAGKSAYFTYPDISVAKLEKKSAQITRVITIYTSMYMVSIMNGLPCTNCSYHTALK